MMLALKPTRNRRHVDMSRIIKSIIHAPHLMPQKPNLPAKNNPAPAKAPILTKVELLFRAMREWNRLGRPVASHDLRIARMSVCQACEYWNAAGNLGLGECQAPGCGCTKFKVWLLNEKCPYPGGSKWPVDIRK